MHAGRVHLDSIVCSSVADPGGVRGVQMHPPFEGLPSRVLSKSAPWNVTTYTTAHTKHSGIP